MHKHPLALISLLMLTGCGSDPAVLTSPDATAVSTSAIRDVFLAQVSRVTWLNNQRDHGDPPNVFLLGYAPSDHPSCHVGDPTPRGIRVQEIFHVTHRATDYPGEHDLVTTLGSAPMYMYDFAAYGATFGNNPARCAFVTDPANWLATGSWSALAYEDNDLSGVDDTPGTNSWGGNESGQLRGANGERYLHEWKYRSRCGPDIPGFCTWMHDVDHVRRVGR